MKVYLITKEKEVIVESANNRNRFWFWNEGAYKLESSCVRLSMKKGGINPSAEIVFSEDSPFPINSTKKENVDMKMFDEVILKNALESVAHVNNSGSIFGWFRNINKEKAIMYICLGLLGIYIVYLYTHGGFK